jgi:phage-related protein
VAEVASAFVSLLPSAKGFASKTERAISPGINSAAKRSGSRFGRIFGSSAMSPLRGLGLAVAGLFVLKKVKDFFVGAIGEAREAQKVSALTANVIRSTGGAAGVSAGQVAQLATSISNLTGIDDEAIQSGANLLLTFTNLRNEAGKGNDVFNQATQTITDMSVALGTDVKGAAIQVGKALNDPIKGITALTRVGVSFTEQQKAQIAAMVASGDTLGAQKLILKELNKEFGGSAAAAATAGDKLKVAFANMQEAVGTKLLPYLDRAELALAGLFVSLTTKTGPAFGGFKRQIMPVLLVLQSLAETVRTFVTNHLEPFLTALSGLGGAAVASFSFLIGNTLVSALVALAGALLSPVALIGAVVGAAIYAYFHFDGFRRVVDNLAAAFMTNVVPALQQFWTYLTTTVAPAVAAFAQEFAANVLPALKRFGDYVMNTVVPNVSELARQVGSNLKPVWDQLVATFTADVLPVLKKLGAALKEHWPQIKLIIETVATLIGKWLVFASTVLGVVLPPLIKFAGFMISKVGPALIAVAGFVISNTARFIEFGKAVVDKIKDVVAFAKAVKDKIAETVTVIKGLPDKAKAALGNLGDLLYDSGKALVQGLIDGIKSMVQPLKDAASAALGVLNNLVPHSPVKEGPLRSWNNGAPGKILMGFLAKGITDGGGAVADAATKVAEAVRAKFEDLRDAAKAAVDSIKSDMASLKDSVAAAFAPDLFSGSIADFFKGARQSNSQLHELLDAVKKLRNRGLSDGFLSAMFNSGNFDFIIDLAFGGGAQNAETIQAANSLFNTNQSLLGQVGGAVSTAVLGDELRAANKKLDHQIKILQGLPKHIGNEVGQAINGAASRGRVRAGAQ